MTNWVAKKSFVILFRVHGLAFRTEKSKGKEGEGENMGLIINKAFLSGWREERESVSFGRVRVEYNKKEAGKWQEKLEYVGVMYVQKEMLKICV